MNNKFDLSGKNALITGATGYLGTAMAQSIAELGATVYINSRSYERCISVVNSLKSLGLKAEPAVFDVTDEEDVISFFKGYGDIPLHILVNNAYLGSGDTIETSSSDKYKSSYDITVTSAHQVFNAALNSLRLAVRESDDASVINVGSMYGIVSPDLRVYDSAKGSNPPYYGAAKAALIHWSRYAACEFGKEGIRINAISPGPFPSKNVQQTAPEFVKTLADKVPLGRIGQSDEIGGPVAFLASSASRFVNGTNLVVDGGWTAW